MAISLRLSDKEAELIRAYTALHGMTVSEFARRSMLERIEEEYDIKVAEEAYQEYVDSGRKSTPVKDFWRELDEEV